MPLKILVLHQTKIYFLRQHMPTRKGNRKKKWSRSLFNFFFFLF